MTTFERMLHILPPWSLKPWGQFWHGCSYLLLWQAGSLDVSPSLHGALLSLSVSERVPWKRHEGRETGRQREGSWGHFPWKEIKVKRMIKVRFPASWFVFCTKIPFFLSDFAETTIAPLPVLVTMTPLTPSLGRSALLNLPQSGNLIASLGFSVEIRKNYSGSSKLHHQEKAVWRRNACVNLFQDKDTIELLLGEAKMTVSLSCMDFSYHLINASYHIQIKGVSYC